MKIICCMLLSALPLYVLATSPSPYAGQESRSIKSLSQEEQSDLLAGRGMGLAKAAELNGYPGPAHVLELADALSLTAEQRARTDALFRKMEARAKALGRQIVESEQSLDQLFASKAITQAALSQNLTAIGALQARLRAVHLEAHLEQLQILTPGQIAQYTKLRGYAAAGGNAGHGHHRRH